IWQRLNVAGDEPAAQSVGSEEGDGGDRYHDISILIATGLGLGRWRGTQPAAKVSMISCERRNMGRDTAGRLLLQRRRLAAGPLSAALGRPPRTTPGRARGFSPWV